MRPSLGRDPDPVQALHEDAVQPDRDRLIAWSAEQDYAVAPPVIRPPSRPVVQVLPRAEKDAMFAGFDHT